MSDVMAVTNNVSSEEPQLNGEEPSANGAAIPDCTVAETISSPPDQDSQENSTPTVTPTDPDSSGDSHEKRGNKRRASAAFNDEKIKAEDFKGFGEMEFNDSLAEYTRAVERMEAEVLTASKNWNPTKHIKITSPSSSTRPSKRQKIDTDSSRPSSALSLRSDGEMLATSSTDVPSSATSSPASRARRTVNVELSSPLYRIPLDHGWKRELVYRAALDSHSKRNADIYYYTPAGKKLRSSREVSEHLKGTGLTLDNFSFFKEPLGVDDPEKEIIRDAKFIRRNESPVSTPINLPLIERAEGKRTPKPKPPKGASPEWPSKIKVKSVGSRLSPQSTPKRKSTDNNNKSAVKRHSEGARRRSRPERTPNGEVSPPGATPSPGKRRARTSKEPTGIDYFKDFYSKSQEHKYPVVVQIFQYLGMRDLAHCARVCRLWRQLAATPALWRHVRMKNSQVSDWKGLCTALKGHGAKRLDLRKMLLPQNDTLGIFWEQFAEHIKNVDTLERIEMCRCPARAVEAVCRSLPGLRSLSALTIQDAKFDPSPLAGLPDLHELRLKSMAGLSLVSDLAPLAHLTHLQHLSLTSIKELGCAACDVVGSLKQLISLELGECTFGAEFGAVLCRLQRLQRLRLERGTAECAAPALLRALATLPALKQLELVNFDVKVGFDDALAECRNVQRLLIIPTYVSQSATTNKQVLSGVLRLRDTLTHLMWGVTIELLRVTELFIDQCEHGPDKKKADIGECIPVLKPVPGCVLPDAQHHVAGPPQVEILPLPTLQRLLSSQLPNTKLKLLRIPFHATWRQSLADFQ